MRAPTGSQTVMLIRSTRDTLKVVVGSSHEAIVPAHGTRHVSPPDHPVSILRAPAVTAGLAMSHVPREHQPLPLTALNRWSGKELCDASAPLTHANSNAHRSNAHRSKERGVVMEDGFSETEVRPTREPCPAIEWHEMIGHPLPTKGYTTRKNSVQPGTTVGRAAGYARREQGLGARAGWQGA